MHLYAHKHRIIVFGLLCIAAVFRFTGINWDNNAHLHPDERFLTMVTNDTSWPNSIREYFDTRVSRLNPHNVGYAFYVYGTYPVYITKAVAQLVGMHTYDGIHLVGRSLSGIIDLCVLLLVYAIAHTIATRLYQDTRRAHLFTLSSTLLYCIAVIPIQQAHFFTVDPYATLFTIITLARLMRHKIDALTGIAFGLALSAKVSAALLSPIIAIVFMYLYIFCPDKPKNTYRKHLLLNLSAFMITMIATVRISYPYLFDGWALNAQVLENWKELKSFDGPDTYFPPALQWISVPVWQPLLDLITWGLGYPAALLAALGIGRIISVTVRSTLQKRAHIHTTDLIFLVLWTLLLLSYTSIQFARAMRYLYPIYPTLAVIGGYALTEFLSRTHGRQSVWVYGGVLASLCILPIAFLSIYTTPHTRIQASTWIYAHISAGKTIAWEHWDDPLPLSLSPYTISQYNTIQLPMYDADTEEKWRSLTQQLADTDYIVLSSNRVYGGTQRAASRFPITHTYYQLLLSGVLGFERVYEATSRPHLPIPGIYICLHPPGFTYGDVAHTTNSCAQNGLTFIDDYAEESFTVYDHPKVTIFQNIARFSAETLFQSIVHTAEIPESP